MVMTTFLLVMTKFIILRTMFNVSLVGKIVIYKHDCMFLFYRKYNTNLAIMCFTYRFNIVNFS